MDALIEGSRTYEQALTFGEWPHPGKPCWVMTRREFVAARPEVRFTAAAPAEVVRQIAAEGHRRVWLVGGGELAASFRAAGFITEYVLTLIPRLGLAQRVPVCDARDDAARRRVWPCPGPDECRGHVGVDDRRLAMARRHPPAP